MAGKAQIWLLLSRIEWRNKPSLFEGMQGWKPQLAWFEDKVSLDCYNGRHPLRPNALHVMPRWILKYVQNTLLQISSGAERVLLS